MTTELKIDPKVYTRITNAYEMCEAVCETLPKEAARYNQSVWHTMGRVEAMEICDTGFCRAGWMVVLASPDPLTKDNLYIRDFYEEALTLLGLVKAKVVDSWGDYEDDATPEDKEYLDDINHLFDSGACLFMTVGTPGYVNEGVRGMREFMAKHEARLKAHKLV